MLFFLLAFLSSNLLASHYGYDTFLNNVLFAVSLVLLLTPNREHTRTNPPQRCYIAMLLSLFALLMSICSISIP